MDVLQGAATRIANVVGHSQMSYTVDAVGGLDVICMPTMDGGETPAGAGANRLSSSTHVLTMHKEEAVSIVVLLLGSHQIGQVRFK